MDTRIEYNRVLEKKRLNAPVSLRDVAVVIANSPDDLFDFLVNNDPTQLWKLLNESPSPSYIGNGMRFKPEAVRAREELKQLYIRKDFADLKWILDRFRINTNTRNYTSDASLLSELESIGEITMKNGGYGFNITF